MFPPETGTLTTIDQGTYPAYSAVGRGTLVISNPALQGNPDAVIRAWEPDRPSRTIVAQADTAIASVALSETMMVWAGVHGPERLDGAYTSAELYWTPFPAGKVTVPILGGTALPAISGLLQLQTWGDHAAVIGTDSALNRVIFVVRLSDGRLWTLRPRAGVLHHRLLAVSSKEILVGESDLGNPSIGGWQILRLARYELALLDELAVR
jgi:hypothetical protein